MDQLSAQVHARSEKQCRIRGVLESDQTTVFVTELERQDQVYLHRYGQQGHHPHFKVGAVNFQIVSSKHCLPFHPS